MSNLCKGNRNMNTEQPFEFEICANGVESCIEAQKGGATRVELCASIPEGGTTPSMGEIAQARQMLTNTRLHVIIRPRGGDFVYSELEAQRMMADISLCKALGVDGIAIGCLTREGDIDMEVCQQLMKAAQGMAVTFHRAFDRARHPQKALEDIISLGCQRLLTSGQASKAPDGLELLKQLNEQAQGRIQLMAGSGVNEDNILHIHQETGIRQFHFSARSPVSHDPEFGDRLLTSQQRVRKTIARLTIS